MSTPDLHLQTCLVLNDAGRIVSTREPQATRGPLFIIVRGSNSCAWSVRADLPEDLADELSQLARDERSVSDFHDAPVHAASYISLLRDRINVVPVTKTRQSDGPAFEFPHSLEQPGEVVLIEDERQLAPNFRGWIPGEIEAGCSPLFAVVENGQPVSICLVRADRKLPQKLVLKHWSRIAGEGLRLVLLRHGYKPFALPAAFHSTAHHGLTTPPLR